MFSTFQEYILKENVNYLGASKITKIIHEFYKQAIISNKLNYLNNYKYYTLFKIEYEFIHKQLRKDKNNEFIEKVLKSPRLEKGLTIGIDDVEDGLFGEYIQPTNNNPALIKINQNRDVYRIFNMLDKYEKIDFYKRFFLGVPFELSGLPWHDKKYCNTFKNYNTLIHESLHWLQDMAYGLEKIYQPNAPYIKRAAEQQALNIELQTALTIRKKYLDFSNFKNFLKSIYNDKTIEYDIIDLIKTYPHQFEKTLKYLYHTLKEQK